MLDGWNQKNLEGNHIINLPLLLSGFHEIASCRKFANEFFERCMDQFFALCDTQKSKEKHETHASFKASEKNERSLQCKILISSAVGAK